MPGVCFGFFFLPVVISTQLQSDDAQGFVNGRKKVTWTTNIQPNRKRQHFYLPINSRLLFCNGN